VAVKYLVEPVEYYPVLQAKVIELAVKASVLGRE
jgi:hypothetical protein